MTHAVRHDDVEAFMHEAEALLRTDQSLHSHVWAIVARLRSPRLPAIDDPYLATVVGEAGELLGCAAGVPGHLLSFSRFTDPAAAPVALAAARDWRRDLCRVLAPADVARAIAAAHRAGGGEVRRLMAQRAFACTRVVEPPPAPGRMRPATPDDRELLERWVGALRAEALDEHDPEGSARLVASALEDGVDRGLVLWDDGQPVSMAGFTGRTPTGITVLSVYTPPDLRGRGYASSCVAALTQRLLHEGCEQVFLSTDLSNPTANRIYAAIGYEPVGDAEVLELA